MLKIGSIAPDFSFTDREGKERNISGFKGIKSVVLFFYPKANTSGCTKEACTFRDLNSDFENLDVVVIGISKDTKEDLEDFSRERNLNFFLASDSAGVVYEKYKVSPFLGFISPRVTYIIDKKGKIVFSFSSVIQFEAHAINALNFLNKQR